MVPMSLKVRPSAASPATPGAQHRPEMLPMALKAHPGRSAASPAIPGAQRRPESLPAALKVRPGQSAASPATPGTQHRPESLPIALKACPGRSAASLATPGTPHRPESLQKPQKCAPGHPRHPGRPGALLRPRGAFRGDAECRGIAGDPGGLPGVLLRPREHFGSKPRGIPPDPPWKGLKSSRLGAAAKIKFEFCKIPGLSEIRSLVFDFMF